MRWTWDSDGHNVGSGLPGAPTPAFLSGLPAPAGTTFEVVFDQAFLDANPQFGNLYYYHCHPHGALGMVGSITVLTTVTHDVIVGPGGVLVFDPADITINVGATVRWTWDSDGHNVGSGLPGAPTPAFLSGPPAPAGTIFEVVFDQAFVDANPIADNIYDYHCHPHGAAFAMVGSVAVLVPCAGDVTGDLTVDISDFLAVLYAWGACPDPCPPGCLGDTNNDCNVGINDFLTVLAQWGACP